MHTYTQQLSLEWIHLPSPVPYQGDGSPIPEGSSIAVLIHFGPFLTPFQLVDPIRLVEEGAVLSTGFPL